MATIAFRRATAATATSNNVTLAAGEPGFETDTGLFKIGNGTDDWNTLPYAGSGGSWGDITGTLSDQTDLQTALDAKQDEDATLTALAAISTEAAGDIIYFSAANTPAVDTGEFKYLTGQTIDGAGAKILVVAAGNTSDLGAIQLNDATNSAPITIYAGENIVNFGTGGSFVDACDINTNGGDVYAGAFSGVEASTIQTAIAANTAGNGWSLVNGGNAGSGSQRYSPAVLWAGMGWKTDATAAGQSVVYRAYVVPVQGTAAPSGIWTLDASINGGGYSTVFSVTSAGVASISSIELGHASDTTLTRASAGVVAVEGLPLATTAYVDAAVVGLLDLKGVTDCSANPNYPSALKGDVYVVSVAGKIGGASGDAVKIGDTFVALADNAGGTKASVGTSWQVLESNLPDLATIATTGAVSDLVGAGTGVLTAIAIAVGSAGAVVVNGGALGKPSSGDISKCTSGTIIEDGDSGTSKTIDWSAGNVHAVTLTGSCTFTMTPPTGSVSVVLRVTANGTGGYTSTLPGNWIWTGGAPDNLPASEVQIWFAWFDGTNYYADYTSSSATTLKVSVADAAADTTTWLMLARSQTGDQAAATDAGISYNASTNTMTIAGGVQAPAADDTGFTLSAFGAAAAVIPFFSANSNSGGAYGYVGNYTSGANEFNVSCTSLLLWDTNASHQLRILCGSNLTAGHDLTIAPGDADRVVTLAGDLTFAGAVTTSGAYGLTLTLTNTTSLTLPTSGTLATLAGSETFTNKSLTSARVITEISPASNDGAALGTTALGWADCHLATGGVINWANGDAIITHSAHALAITSATGGPLVTITGDAPLMTIRNTAADDEIVLQVKNVANATTFSVLGDGFCAGSVFQAAGSVAAGAVAGATGTFVLTGVTSGTVTLSVADAAGTHTIKLPTTTGSAGQALVTNGSGQWGWVTLEEATSTASSATPTPTGGSARNLYTLTALATNATFAAPSGSPAHGNRLLIIIVPDATPRTLSFNAIYRWIGQTAPTTTVASKIMMLAGVYDSGSSKWLMSGLAQET